MPRQILTLRLDGITAADYLAHFRDPEPAALGHALRSVDVRAEPLGDTIEAVLVWEETVPAPCAAAQASGLPRVAEVVSIVEHSLLRQAA